MSVTEPPLNTSKKPKKLVNVVLLTGHELQTFVDVKAKFQDVFNQVAAHHGLREVEYFGLAESKDEEYHFLNLEEKVHKHAPKAWKSSSGEGLDKHGKPHLTVYFRVQYFVDQVILLREKITRQLYYLQLKENVLNHGYLFSEERCFQLAAYALQTDLGNYSVSRYATEDYFDPREYFPAWVVQKRGNSYLTSYVPTMHGDLKNTTRGDAQLKFIREASLSPAAHNLHFYRLKKRKTDKVHTAWLGICPKGVEIYEDSADGFKDLISTFFWPDIGKLYFEKKKFEIRSVGSWDGRKFTYYTDSDSKSKFLLSLCRSTHMFQMAIQPKLSEIRHLDAEDKRYRESYIYSDARDMAANRAVSPARSLLSPKTTGTTGQRYSVVSNTSSNTTSGIVSDKLHISFDESEEFEDDPMAEIMIDSPPRPSMADYSPRPAMGTAMLTTPKQGRGRLPLSTKTSTSKERQRSPVTRSGSNVSQGSKGSGHADLSPVTSNGSYRSRLQQHQQMIQGARLQQMAIQPQPFTNQSRAQTSPQAPLKRAPSPSALSAKSQSFNVPVKPNHNTQTPTSASGQVLNLPPKVPTPISANQSPSSLKGRVQDNSHKKIISQSAGKVQGKVSSVTSTKPPLPPTTTTPHMLQDNVAEEKTPLTQPLNVTLPITSTTSQPYTAQQVQVKQPQQFLAQQVSPSQPKHPQQYYFPSEQISPLHPKPTPVASQYSVQQHTTPLQQFAQEQPVSQQQFAVPLSHAQKFALPVATPQPSQQMYVMPPQTHQQFLVPLSQQQFSIVHSKSHKQYAVQPPQPQPIQQPPQLNEPVHHVTQPSQLNEPQQQRMQTQHPLSHQGHPLSQPPQRELQSQLNQQQQNQLQAQLNQPQQNQLLTQLNQPQQNQLQAQMNQPQQNQLHTQLNQPQQHQLLPQLNQPQQNQLQAQMNQPQQNQLNTQLNQPQQHQLYTQLNQPQQNQLLPQLNQPPHLQSATPHQLIQQPHQLTPPANEMSQPAHQLSKPLIQPCKQINQVSPALHQLNQLLNQVHPSPNQKSTTPPQLNKAAQEPAPSVAVYSQPQTHQFPHGNPPQYEDASSQMYSRPDQKSSRPASRGDSFNREAGPLKLHEKSNSAPTNPPPSLDLNSSLSSSDRNQSFTSMSLIPSDDVISVNSSVALAEIDKAYAPLFDNFDQEYLVSESDDMSVKDILDTPLLDTPLLTGSRTSPAFSYEDLEKALDKIAISQEMSDMAEQDLDEEAIKARRTRIAVKNKKERLHPELEEIRGNVKQFSLPLITALFNDTTLVPANGGQSSDLTYDASTICSTDSRWSYDTDTRRLSSSYPSSTGTMISLYSASRPFSWHSEHFDLDAQLAASFRLSNGRPAALMDNTRSEPRYLNEVVSSPPVGSWTQAISYGNPYGLTTNLPVDRYSPDLLASQHMIPPKISSGGHNKPDSNIKTLKENVGIA